MRLLRGLHVSDVSGYLIVSATASCRDITCKSIPGSGPDGISTWMLRTFADSVSPSIASLFNLSTVGSCQPSGSSPTLFQSLKSHPNKMFASTDLSPFCPPSANAWKGHIYRLLLEYLSSNQLLSDAQFGFRSGRSTVMPLLLATHQWHTTLESHKQVACVFFDLRKAFDSVPHQALLNKLHNLQVPGTLLLWLFNYLSNRHQ